MLDDRKENPWTIVSSTQAYQNPWITVMHHEVLTPFGRPGIYGIVNFRHAAVGVVPLHDNGHVDLVGQWRLPIGQFSWEIPEGGMDDDEVAADCARRELREETGLSCSHLRQILDLSISNAITNQRAAVFLATGLVAGEAAPDETEMLQRASIPFQKALDLATSGKISDAMTVAGLLRVFHMARSGQLDATLAEKILS